MTESNAKRYRILALDGGGIRGIITAVWLDRLEETLEGPVREHVDLIAGTSTGGILACALANGIPAAKIIQMYRYHGREIFPAPASRMWNRVTRVFTQGISAPKYDDIGLERVLRRQFGDTTFGDLPRKPTVLITSYNTLTREAVVFKNTSKDFANLALWEIAKASSSAPTYFPAHKTRIRGADAPLIDGGVVANNPATCAIAEGIAEKTDIELKDFVVGAFGTGQTTRPISISEAREWGALEWAIPIIDVLMDGAGDAVDYINSHLISGDRYFRFQTRLDNAYDDMDNASETNINALVNVANHFLTNEGGQERIKRLAKMLKS